MKIAKMCLPQGRVAPPPLSQPPAASAPRSGIRPDLGGCSSAW